MKTWKLILIGLFVVFNVHAQTIIQSGVQLTVNQTGFSAVHFLPHCVQFELYDTTGHTLTGKLSMDAQFQVNLNVPGVGYWPYENIEISFTDGTASTLIENYVNVGASNFTLEIYGPHGVVHNAPVQTTSTPGFQPLGTFADLGITQPGDYYLKVNWQQKPAAKAPAPYSVWEDTLLIPELQILGINQGILNKFQTWLSTHPPTP